MHLRRNGAPNQEQHYSLIDVYNALSRATNNKILVQGININFRSCQHLVNEIYV